MSYLKINNLEKDRRILEFKQVYALEKVHGCFRADALINMADGSYKEIKSVNAGDMVKSYDTINKIFVDKKVVNAFAKPVTDSLDWYEFTLENGSKFVCTEDHPILTTLGWVQAKNITEKYDIISI